MSEVQSASGDEIRGDWNNIKGTEYHLLYALWLLLRKHAGSVAFYQGNDLVAQPLVVPPSAPPRPCSELDDNDEDSPAVPLHAEHVATDVWVQLKATKSAWTPSRLLAKNLLINFIHNALHSERLGREWRASLVTQGLVQRREIEYFIRSPRSYRDLNRRLTEIVNIARDRLRAEGWMAADVKPPRLRRVALAVLSQLADSEPVPLGMLKSDIEAELTHAYQDRDVVRQIGDSLIGAIIRDAGLGPSGAHAYDADWINQAAGRAVIRLGLLNDDPVAACAEAVRRAASELRYEAQRFTPRTRLENALRQFMLADEVLFVLVGASGSGKSWASAYWADETLGGHLRLLVPGADLDYLGTLQSLVANRLRPFSSVQWEDDLFLRRLTAAAELEGRGPVTIVIDDLIPTGEVGAYRRNLARIVVECRVRRIKLLLTCQRHVWELHRLGAEMSPDDLFVMSADLPREDNAEASGEASARIYFPPDHRLNGRRYSFLLADFSPEEQRDALRQQLPRARADEITDQLRAPGFTLLRSPYLLSRYLERNRFQLEGTDDAPPMDMDALLDWHIASSIERAALELSCSPDDLRPALTALVESLWTSRPAGLTFAQAAECLAAEFPERGTDVLAALRRFGLMTIEGPVRIVEPLASDRLFALHAGEQLRLHGDDFLDELNVEIDAGLVTALLRREAPDPVAIADKLLARNREWAGAIAAGLAQGSPDDWRSLAILTTLAASDDEQASRAAYAALGQIAARGDRSWKWAAEMYLGDHARKWHRGARALAGTIEYRPQRVEAAVRTRLARVLHIDEVFSTNREKRMKWLTHNALDPLRGINHESATQVGNRLLRRYEPLAGDEEDNNRDWSFLNDLDHARGRIALFGGGDYLSALLDELGAGSDVARYRAALALRPVIVERPDAVREVLCARLAAETDWQVLERLLLIAFHLIARYPDELLTALRQSRALNLGEPLITTGLVLSLLGNLSGKRHIEVEQLLPSRLDAYEGWTRAFLTEMLTYAWWRCAERNEAARHRLIALAEPDLTDVSDDCIPFALRGSAIALLGLMCIEQGISADELTGQQVFYPNMGKKFLYIETEELFRKNAALLRQHPSFGRFEELLIRCLNEEERVQVHPIYPVREAQFRCAVKCLDLLVHAAALMDDPLPLLNSLPRNWQAIRAATRLLELGRTESPVVAFARESFAGLEHQGTMQAVEERRRCQAQLALLEEDAEASLQEQRRSSVNFLLFQKPGNALGLSVLAAKEPGNLLLHLDRSIQTEHDLPTLYYLVEEARSWQTLLIARVYGRMFNSRHIDLHEARDLCEQMLAAVRMLPDSPLRQEYVAIYSAVDTLLHSHNTVGPVLPSLPSDAEVSLIRSSHELAAEILTRSLTEQSTAIGGLWIDDLLYDRRGSLETDFYELRHNLLLQGTAYYIMYFFPAVRLAFAAVGEMNRLRDPAGHLMAERWKTYEQLREQMYLLDHASLEDYDADLVERGLDAFERRAEVAPRDERLQNWLGHLLLRLNRLTEAESAFQRSLALPGCHGDARASALYNLACVYARQNNENACQRALEESANLKQPDKQWLTEDPDLESVREREWFRSLLESDA